VDLDYNSSEHLKILFSNITNKNGDNLDYLPDFNNIIIKDFIEM